MISAPVVAFAIIGGFLNKVTAREDTYPQLRIFQDVVQLITGSYVDPVNVDKVMTGAMHGLADSLDPDSAYLSADQVRQIETNAPQPTADVGLDLTRQYYLRVIAARDGSSAAKAGLRTGDYVRIIGDTPTREMSRQRCGSPRHRTDARSAADGRRHRADCRAGCRLSPCHLRQPAHR